MEYDLFIAAVRGAAAGSARGCPAELPATTTADFHRTVPNLAEYGVHSYRQIAERRTHSRLSSRDAVE